MIRSCAPDRGPLRREVGAEARVQPRDLEIEVDDRKTVEQDLDRALGARSAPPRSSSDADRAAVRRRRWWRSRRPGCPAPRAARRSRSRRAGRRSARWCRLAFPRIPGDRRTVVPRDAFLDIPERLFIEPRRRAHRVDETRGASWSSSGNDRSDLRHRPAVALDDVGRPFLADAIDETAEVLGGVGGGDRFRRGPSRLLSSSS